MDRATNLIVAVSGLVGALGGGAAMAQQASPDDVRAVVAQMLADAETRSNLLAGGPGAGHDDGGFFLAADGFRLNVKGQIQFRYFVNVRDDSNSDDFQPGFQTRRTKLDFEGEVHDDWFYRVRVSFDRADGAGKVDYAYAGYNFGNGWKVQWGQFKLPLLREELVSDSKQLAVERSIVNGIFTQDYSQGVMVQYEQEAWRVAAAFSDGLFSSNTDFTADPADYAFTGRFEYRFGGGGWKAWEDFTSKKGDPFGAMVGGAVHFEDTQNTGAATDVDTSTLRYTADASLKVDGWNAYGAFVGTHENIRGPVSAGNPHSEFDDFGAIIQGGYRFTEKDELFARWEAVFADPDRGTAVHDFHFLTVGMNHYFAGHAIKATADVVYSFNKTAPNLTGIVASSPGLRGFPTTGAGILGDLTEGEYVFRLQFQLLF